jgi:hypothetical protein
VLEEPLRVDRQLSSIARSLRSFRAALREGRGDEHAFELVGQQASRELIETLADATRDPLAPPLLRAAHRLHEAHVLAELEHQHSAAVRLERHAVDEPERGRFTLATLRANALADTTGRRGGFLRVLSDRASHASDLVLRRAERHAELRASLARFVPADIDLPGRDVLEAAPAVLAGTADAFRALGPRTLAEVIELGLGRDSRASWPARLTPRSIADFFVEGSWLAHLTPEPFAVPPALGASSFLRALYGFGVSLRSALAASKQPFVLARDPYGLERATLGSLFALLPTKESFARRHLGVALTGMSDHRRSLARVLLVELRAAALRVSLRAPALCGGSTLLRAYSELGDQALGVELHPSLLGVIFTPRSGDAQRFAAMLTAAALDHRLTEAHDDDWFRNPRAVEELREAARAPAPIVAEKEDLERGAALLTAWLTSAL